MTQPIESVAATAATPGQAQVFCAVLRAQGIPARVDGDLLADEWAVSRRLMNLLGTRVMVPTASLSAARELLQPASISLDDLTAQALAAPMPSMRASTGGAGAPHSRGAMWIRLLLSALMIALVWQLLA